MIEIVLVGAGDVVAVRHAPILSQLSDRARVTHVVTTRKERAELVQRILGYSIRHARDISEIPTGSDISGALVAVPPAITADIAELVARKNYSLYIEKPIAPDVISGLKLRDTLERVGRPAVVGENFREQARFGDVRERVESSEISHLEIRDQLRRGNRDVPRTDNALWGEHLVHISSAARYLLDDSIETVEVVGRVFRGASQRLELKAQSTRGVPIDIDLRMVNTWSEDRYSLSLGLSRSVEIKHDYNPCTMKYDDKIEYWSAQSDEIEFVSFKSAACGIESLWQRLLASIESGAGPDLHNIRESILDVQFREAAHLSERIRSSVTIPDLFGSDTHT